MLRNYKFYRKAKGGVWYKDGDNTWTRAKSVKEANRELEQLRALEPFGATFHVEVIEEYLD